MEGGVSAREGLDVWMVREEGVDISCAKTTGNNKIKFIAVFR